MHTLRENARGVETVIRDVGASLHQYRGPDGLRLLMEQGKLSILSAFGEFKKSNDEIYNSRMKVVSGTRIAIMKLSNQFDAVGDTIGTLTTQLDKICAGLQEFMEICEESLEEESVEPAYLFELGDIQSSSNKIRALGHDLASNIKVSSCGIQSATLEQVDSTYLEVKSEVARAQTTFDVQRRQAEVYGSELAKIQRDTDPDRARMAEYKHRRSLESLQGTGEQYHAALRCGMEKTSFVLEQASMATWSASNVFFLQLSVFFKDLVSECKQVADVLTRVKNNRRVSRRINSEKQAAAAAIVRAPVKAEVSEGVQLDYELVDMFASQPSSVSPPSLIVHEDTASLGVRDHLDLDDIFK